MATPFPFTFGQKLTSAQMNAITTLPINDQTASYTAVLSDVGKRIVMNVATANTVTINNSIFSVGDTIFIANKAAGITTITAGAGVTINTSGSLALAQHGGGTLVALSASVFTFFSSGGIGYGTATGGSSSSITVDGVPYTMLTFTSDSNLVVSKAGLFDVFAVAGGGGGGTQGAGGAGGVLQQTVYLTAGTATVDIGAGGVQGLNGLSTYIGTTSYAIGGGSSDRGDQTSRGFPGGSGGGASPSGAAGVGAPGQGNNGGTTISGGGGGGGGGAGAVGSNGTSGTGGAGGIGITPSTFSGGTVTTQLAGGGGGGALTTAGSASYGGGAGAIGVATASNGTANTGGGGGGYYQGAGGSGGSGILFVRFKS